MDERGRAWTILRQVELRHSGPVEFATDNVTFDTCVQHNVSHGLPSVTDCSEPQGRGEWEGSVPLLFCLCSPVSTPPVSPPVSAPATAFPVFPQSFDMENSLRRGKFSHAGYAGFTTED